MDLYHNASFETSKLFTARYSTSFSLGILAFAPRFRNPIYAVYGYVRLADEIVDSFLSSPRKELLTEFREETYKALQRGISTNPVIHAFQKTVLEYNIDREYIDAFLDSMAMDLDNSSYDNEKYDSYIYGSAEVVGLMCLKVFVNGSQEDFNRLLAPARALGSAFQKVNFLRDIKSDIEERGRIYLPDVDSLQHINEEQKYLLEESVENEFRHAMEGIKALPVGVRLGVYSAYLYYYQLFKKIRSSNVDNLMKERIRVSNPIKFCLLLKAIWEVKVLKTC